ncbi:hypothetical protein CsSME_00041199 [Camellia sinensis var. sinensis]
MSFGHLNIKFELQTQFWKNSRIRLGRSSEGSVARALKSSSQKFYRELHGGSSVQSCTRANPVLHCLLLERRKAHSSIKIMQPVVYRVLQTARAETLWTLEDKQRLNSL